MDEMKMMPGKDVLKDIEHAIEFECRDDVLNDKQTRFAEDARCPSQSSSLSSNSGDICRICHCEGGLDSPLITPCYCSGSLRYVHQACLQQWIKSSNIRNCELCKFQFIMHTKVKPFNEWEYLEMSGLERKKLLCAMLFHIIAMTCVCWSLYVLIDRTLDEVQKGHLEWPFWTKLIVVGIGFMGGIVFMYIQCKAYFILCKRWKAYNRVIYVQNAPENPCSRVNRATAGSSNRCVVEPSCSSKKIDPRKSSSDNLPETSCIDIKGVRNLHIFFGEENQIRLHRNERLPENKALTQGERCANDNETAANGKNADKANHMCGNTSLHIQIGNMDYNDCNRVNGKSCNSAFNKYGENGSYGGALCPADLKANRTPECDSNGRYRNEFKNDQSVVKLQIKKAEIVIEFGENSDAVKYANKTTADSDSNGILKSFDTCDAYREMEIVKSPRRKFNSEEYLDCEKVANEYNELPTSGLLICKDKVPFNSCKEKFLKDWRSSEDLVRDNKISNVRF